MPLPLSIHSGAHCCCLPLSVFLLEQESNSYNNKIILHLQANTFWVSDIKIVCLLWLAWKLNHALSEST